MKALVLLVLLVGTVLPCHAQWRERRAALHEMHQAGEFRIFYALSGQDALPNVQDSNRNGVPDYVDRVAAELATAREAYENGMHLAHPLQSPRYRNQAQFIDVHLMSFPLTSNGPKHGIAYDELSSFDRPRDGGRKVRVLVMDISNALSPGNLTPRHELFHLYQNGYTFFKNRWFTEGTARWAEQGVFKAGPLPTSSAEVQSLFQKTYDTAPFWSALGSRVDSPNGAFIKAFLEELGRVDDRVSTGKWNEKQQMSPTNDVHIWQALRNTLEQPVFRRRWDADVHLLMEVRL
ncbi:MAG: hypothetical protein ABW171_07500 [Steroidobacter sp.]